MLAAFGLLLATLLLISPARAYSPEDGIWWNPNEPGYGLQIETQDDPLTRERPRTQSGERDDDEAGGEGSNSDAPRRRGGQGWACNAEAPGAQGPLLYSREMSVTSLDAFHVRGIADPAERVRQARQMISDVRAKGEPAPANDSKA